MSNPSRAGVFGGSFDPPHLAHTLAALWALETGEVDRILIVPVATHPFGKECGAPCEHRMEMCRLAFRRLEHHVEISDIETRLGGVSYTYRTIQALMDERPGTSFRLIVGSDVVGDLPKWRNGRELLKLAPVLELPRPGAASRDSAAQEGIFLPAISSTRVREALRSGQSARQMLGAEVWRYIKTNGLYPS